MTPPTVIGIDPGQTGAVAILHGTTGALIAVEDMPVIDKRVNAAMLADLLRPENAIGEPNDLGYARMVVVEAVHAMPKQGVSSSFNFGHSLGVIHGVIGALALPQCNVTPQEWKKHHRLIGTAKGASRQRATELYPAHASLFARVKDDGRADAVLIARWWIDTHGGVR